jgi:hypothetical protein
MINHAPLYTKKNCIKNFYRFFSRKTTAIFLYKNKLRDQMGDIQGRNSVAGVAGVAAAMGIVEAPLGATAVAATRTAPRAATRAMKILHLKKNFIKKKLSVVLSY